MMKSLPLKIARILVWIFVVAVALITLGSLVKNIPVASAFGPSTMSTWGSWLTIAAFAAAALGLRRWDKSRTRAPLVMAVLAGFAAFGAIYVQVRQIAVANANGVQISVSEMLFGVRQPPIPSHPESFVYGTHDGHPLALDVYRAIDSRSTTSAPVLVYIHGGGWVANDRTQREADLQWFAAQGYLVISLDYSLSSEHAHMWDVVQPELGCALTWIGENGARFGGDLAHLSLIGESAGGNLVLNVSYMANQGKLTPSCPGKLPHIVATVALYPVIDVALAYRNPDLTIGRFGRWMAIDYTGGSPDEFSDRYRTVSSMTYINALAPSTLLVVPDSDSLVDPRAAYAFAEQAHSAGVAIRLIRVPFAQHSFDMTLGSIGNQLVRQSTIRFLREQGAGP